MSTGMQGCLAELVLIMKMSSVITKQIKLNQMPLHTSSESGVKHWENSQSGCGTSESLELCLRSERQHARRPVETYEDIWTEQCLQGKKSTHRTGFSAYTGLHAHTQRYAMTAVVGWGGWLLFQPPRHGQSLSALTDSMFPDWEGLSQPFSHCDHPTSPSPFSAAGSTTLFLHCLQPSSSSHLLPEVCRNCIIRCW